MKNLERNLNPLDQLAESTVTTITLLAKYRTALIFAVTTGKIDVRQV